MKYSTLFILIALTTTTIPSAYAYVDPGIVSTLFQGLFAVVVGAITMWTTGFWVVIKGWFGKKPSVPVGTLNPEIKADDAALSAPPEDASRKR